MFSGHSYKEKAVRRKLFTPPGTPQHAGGFLSVSQPISEHRGKAVPSWGRGSPRSLSLPGPPSAAEGDKCHQLLPQGSPTPTGMCIKHDMHLWMPNDISVTFYCIGSRGEVRAVRWISERYSRDFLYPTLFCWHIFPSTKCSPSQ